MTGLRLLIPPRPCAVDTSILFQYASYRAYRLDRPNRTHTHMSSSTVHAHTNQGVWKGKGENIDSVRPSHTRLREAAM